MLFDEPLSNLDARLRRSMREEIRALQQRLGLTVAYVTHDQSEALAVSDQIIVMDAGAHRPGRHAAASCTSSPPASSSPASWARRCGKAQEHMSIEFRQVTKRYGDAKSPLVVKGVDLVVPKGSLTTILGPSGCGKTTDDARPWPACCRPPAAASCWPARTSRKQPAHRREMGLVFQSYALFPHLTAYENVAFGLRLRKVGSGGRTAGSA